MRHCPLLFHALHVHNLTEMRQLSLQLLGGRRICSHAWTWAPLTFFKKTSMIYDVGDMAPYRQWHITSARTSVTGKLQKRNQPSEAHLSLPTGTHRKSEKHPSDRGRHRFRKVAKPLSNLLNKNTTNKEAHKQSQGKPSFRRRHKMFKTVTSVQARSVNERRKLGIRTPSPFFQALWTQWTTGPQRLWALLTCIPHFMAWEGQWQVAA